MTMIEELAHYWTKRAYALENACKKAKDKLKNGGTYPIDEAFSDGLRLWVDAWDGWLGQIPSILPPTKQVSIGAGATDYATFVYVGPLDDPNPANTGLTVVSGTGDPGSSWTVTTALQSNLTLKFDINGLDNTRMMPGDLYQCTCFRVDATSGAIVPIAILFVSVT